jgi:hypothetical protein
MGSDFPNVWSALEFLAADPRANEDTTDFSQHLRELHQTVRDIEFNQVQQQATVQNIGALEATIGTHNTRFDAIHPILMKLTDLGNKFMEWEIRQSQRAAKEKPSDPWLQHLSPQPLMTGVPVVTPPSTPGNATVDYEARLRTLKHTIKSLEKRSVGDGVRIGRFLFQSQEELRIWIVSHVPNNRFGLFIDGVSVFDFLAQSHMDSQDNMAHMYNSQKNGFETTYESRAISSMQNLFPNIFGKNGSDGMDTSQTLPGLKSVDKWNGNDVTGLRLQVERELPNSDAQFRNAIAHTFDPAPEARDLALELLYKANKFALDLCNFIQRDYDFWKHKGYTKKEAWDLTCLSVRRIFEDIHVVRVVGRDSRDTKNPVLTATQVIWATLRAHVVMDEYSRRNFFEHPSISAVIARHLASHHVRPDESLETKFTKLDERVTSLASKVDGILSRLARLEIKNGISPPKKGRGGGKHKNDPKDKDADAKDDASED